MAAFYAWLSTVVTKLITTPLTHLISYFMGRREGRVEQQREQEIAQHAQDLETIAKAEAARRAVKHDDRSVRDDPFNRDNDA